MGDVGPLEPWYDTAKHELVEDMVDLLHGSKLLLDEDEVDPLAALWHSKVSRT